MEVLLVLALILLGVMVLPVVAIVRTLFHPPQQTRSRRRAA